VRFLITIHFCLLLVFCVKQEKIERVAYFALRAQKIATDEYSFPLLVALIRRQPFLEHIISEGDNVAVFTGAQLMQWFITHPEWKETISKEDAGEQRREHRGRKR
jgi:hypothetical protein